MIGSAQKKHDFQDTEALQSQWSSECNNHAMLGVLTRSLQELGTAPEDITIVSGGGYGANVAQCITCNYFKGISGAALSLASGIKAANNQQTVLALESSVDVCMNSGRLVRAIKRNIDITVIVYSADNVGLGDKNDFDVATFAVALDAAFVARAHVADPEEARDILTEAVQHRGCAIVEMIGASAEGDRNVSETCYVDDAYDEENQVETMRHIAERKEMLLGVIYAHNRNNVDDEMDVRGVPLHRKEVDMSIRHALAISQK